jgi:hypothetical protein
MVAVRAFLVWIVIIAVESIYGIVRTLFLVPRIGDLPARQLGVFTGSLLIFAVSLLFVRWLGATTKQLFAIGIFWVILTVSFEIVLGRALLELSWDRIIQDYDLSRGGYMAFGLIAMALSPWLASQVRSVSMKKAHIR